MWLRRIEQNAGRRASILATKTPCLKDRSTCKSQTAPSASLVSQWLSPSTANGTRYSNLHSCNVEWWRQVLCSVCTTKRQSINGCISTGTYLTQITKLNEWDVQGWKLSGTPVVRWITLSVVREIQFQPSNTIRCQRTAHLRWNSRSSARIVGNLNHHIYTSVVDYALDVS